MIRIVVASIVDSAIVQGLFDVLNVLLQIMDKAFKGKEIALKGIDPMIPTQALCLYGCIIRFLAVFSGVVRFICHGVTVPAKKV